jgi:hypothetical protein
MDFMLPLNLIYDIFFQDLSIHVDFMLPVNEEDDRDETESENDDVNDTSEMKKARLQYKLSKATLMRKFDMDMIIN